MKPCVAEGFIEDLGAQIAAKEGCRIHGKMSVQKVHTLAHRLTVAPDSCLQIILTCEFLLLNREMPPSQVAGNLHIAPGHSYSRGDMHAHDLMSLMRAGVSEYNLTHKVFARCCC